MSFVLHRWAVHALDLVLPPRCPSCGSATEAGHHNLCPECWRNLDLLGPPWCACCGLPFPVSA
ncbi:MAG: double zinc ribbon domain-containing protein, partial [Pseudomonadota bacterium]|nr:double zinc ribbon domain-containing protein [Pseudomonadota bacterium]